jgi:hypothetical protein
MKSPMELKDNSTDKDSGQSIQDQVRDSSNSDRSTFQKRTTFRPRREGAESLWRPSGAKPIPLHDYKYIYTEGITG